MPIIRMPAAMAARNAWWTRSMPKRAIRCPALAPAIPAAPMAIHSRPAPALLQSSRSATSCAPKDQIAVLAAPVRKAAAIKRLSALVSDGMPWVLVVALWSPRGRVNAAANARPTATTAKPA
ncbi:hypothetical protein D3C87_1761940 [compost metagenome]